MPTATVRPFNVYGPGQVGEGALRIFIERALAGEEILIHGDGNQIRAWTYVDDFVDALELCLWKPEAVGESFNIGNARAAVSVRGLAEAVIRVTESSSSIRHVEAAQADIHLRNPEVDVRHVEAAQADIHLRVPEVSKARKLLGFEAQVDLEEGIRRTAESIRARAD